MATVVDGSQPASKVLSTVDPNIKCLVVANPDGSNIGGAASTSVTPHFVNLGASSSQVIPIGAKGWSVAIITGTAAIGAATGLPAGLSDSDPNTLLATITVATDAASSAYVRWNT